ncbi:uncharacterized protein UTRI_10088 [Ustilago trichophora]|uniref:Xylanolytic transcriptional activator regulatory domain-containing protein n=1 Tax=Ustilago trichophora TaxID=86804 RepID=A0A5C3E7T2_9BASI|nr:uncharacterized protein UTRI_10088 [Ustilago trichophora]
MDQALRRISALESRVGMETISVDTRQPTASTRTHALPASAMMDGSVKAPFTDIMDKGGIDSNGPSRSHSPESETESHQDHPTSTMTNTARLNGTRTLDRASMHEQTAAREDGVLSTNGRNRPSDSIVSVSTATSSIDPISNGLLTSNVAAWLLRWFLDRCHPFLPFFDARESRDVQQMQQQEPFLLTVILAISARFGALSECPMTQANANGHLPEHLTQLAEILLGQTLTRSRFHLSDVHAVLFLHAWGLRPLGSGSDTWILSGHAFRLAKRLGIDKTVSSLFQNDSQTLAMRRTWLLLCASDCFPSLGFGRPFSPKENLDLCANVIARLKHDHLVRGIDIGADAFVAAQGELAQISRRLLEWVADASSQLRARSHGMRDAYQQQSWADVESIWNRYRDLNQQLQTCDAQWNEGLKSSTERRCAALYRWHVRLCLPSFALRLNDIAAGAVVIDTQSRRTENHCETKIEASRYRQLYRQAILRSSEAIVKLHADEEDTTFAYVPDYLVMALAQACVAHVGLVVIESDEMNTARSDSSSGTGAEAEAAHRLKKQAAELVASTLTSLKRLASEGAILAHYLSIKVASTARKARVPTGDSRAYSDHTGLDSNVNVRGGARASKRQKTREHPPDSALRHLVDLSTSSPIEALADGAVRRGVSHNAMDSNVSPESSSLQDLLDASWPGGDNADQIAQAWFNAEDPLRLLFGDDIEMLSSDVLGGTDADLLSWNV